MPLFLPEQDVHSALPMHDLIPAMETALADFSAGRVVQPVRTVLKYPPSAFFGVMPAYDPTTNLVGAKLVLVVPENLAKGLPTHQALIVLFDPPTGQPVAI